MEKLLMNPYDKEYMKMAILKHEETFREQVYELHRLYQIQKLLMKNMGIRKLHVQELGTWNLTSELEHDHHQDNINNKNINNTPKRPRQLCDIDLERPAASRILDVNEDETELELTLGPASHYCSRRRKKKTSIGSDSAVAGAGSFSSSSTGSSNIISSNNNKKASSENHYNHHQRIYRTKNSSSEVVVEDDEEQPMIRQDRHANPPWLFQALSLNTS